MNEWPDKAKNVILFPHPKHQSKRARINNFTYFKYSYDQYAQLTQTVPQMKEKDKKHSENAGT